MNEITKQIVLIEQYVRFAEALPTELRAVKIYLGYDTSDVTGLDPESMQSLFIELRAHVDLWKQLTTQARSQLRELSITAASVVKNGDGLMRGLNALDTLTQMLNTVGNAALNDNDFKAKGANLDKSTLARLNNLQPYIDALHSTSLESLGDTDDTNNLVDGFRTQGAILEAKVADKVDKLKLNNSTTIGQEKTIGPVIASFKEACARIVSEFGEGSMAGDKVRTHIENTLKELTQREVKLQKQQRLTYAVGRLFVHLQGLGHSMIDTQSALTQLWLASSKTCTRLNSIATDTCAIGTEETLLSFYLSYEKVLGDWATISDEASNLYKAL